MSWVVAPQWQYSPSLSRQSALICDDHAEDRVADALGLRAQLGHVDLVEVAVATISSAASCGMMPSSPCTLASAASMSRYFAVRFSSDQTCPHRVGAEDVSEDGGVDDRGGHGGSPIGKGFSGQRGPSGAGLCLQDDRAVHHAPVHLGGAGCRPRSAASTRRAQSSCASVGAQRGVDRLDLRRVDAELGAETVARRDTPRSASSRAGHRSGGVTPATGAAQPGAAGREREPGRPRRPARPAPLDVQIQVQREVERAESQPLHALGRGDRVAARTPRAVSISGSTAHRASSGDDVVHLLGRLGLGQHHRRSARRPASSGEVLGEPGVPASLIRTTRAWPGHRVDRREPGADRVPGAGLSSGRRPRPRGRARRRRRRRPAPCEALRPVAGHEQVGAGARPSSDRPRRRAMRRSRRAS